VSVETPLTEILASQLEVMVSRCQESTVMMAIQPQAMAVTNIAVLKKESVVMMEPLLPKILVLQTEVTELKLPMKTVMMAMLMTLTDALQSAKLKLAGSVTKAQEAETTSAKKFEEMVKIWAINNEMIRTFILVMVEITYVL